MSEVSSFDLSRWIRPGDVVGWGQASAEPTTLTRMLANPVFEGAGITCFVGIPADGSEEILRTRALRFLSYCSTGENGRIQHEDRLDVLRIDYSRMPETVAELVNVVLLLLPPPRGGEYSLGLAADYVLSMISGARTVIAEVSEQVPHTEGASIPESKVDVVFRTDSHPRARRQRSSDGLSLLIARNVAELIPDGATVQAGLGALPDTVLAALSEHNDLGLHTGMLTDSALPLLRSGVVTNRRKPMDHGISVAGLITGTEALFEYVDDNPSISLRDVGYTHHPAVLSALPCFVAINSALQVDGVGRVNSEAIGSRHVGAVGGLRDFLHGASASRGGLPIVALPSNRVVASLDGPATLSHESQIIVVTELGHADLRGVAAADRPRLLAEIASPEFLEKEEPQ